MTHTSDDGSARFEALYREHRSRVGSYLRRRGAVDPDGLAAEVFLTLWRRLPDVTGPELPWLYRTAGYLLANDRRTRATADRVPALLAGERSHADDDSRADPAARVDGAPDGELLQALASLAAPDREVLLLVAWEDLQGAELASALGCSRVAARARLSRARHRLAAALRPPGAPRSTTAATGDLR